MPNADNIDHMMATLPHNEQVIVKRLRALVAECIPQATENAYDGLCMPFYKKRKLICFILPASVSLDETDKLHSKGNNKMKEGVGLGFNQGRLMSNEDGVLLAEGRKQVYMMYFRELGDIEEKQVKALLFEAAMIDDTYKDM